MRAKSNPAPTRFEGETFKDFGPYELDNLVTHWQKPDCFNGVVRVHKWRVVIKRVEEPNEVIAARILKLWRECDNHHHWAPLRRAAAEIGLTLSTDDVGVDRVPRSPR